MTAETSSPLRFSGRQRLILLVLLGAAFIFAADYSILNVALPQVGGGVDMGLTQLPWIVSAYTLPAAGFMLLFGRFADLFGRRKLFIAGEVLLAVASLLGGFATNPEMLLAARALQGLSTAMAVPAGLSLITTTFAEGKMRDRALGLNGAILSGGFTAGALVGGILVSLLSWRAAFFINIPFAIAIIVATPMLISESKVPNRQKLDVPGAVTVTGGLLAVVYAIMESSLVAAAIGIVLLAAFWVIETKSSAPLAPVRFLKKPTVKWGNFAGLVIFSMETGMIFLMTLYLQDVLKFNPVITGLAFGIPGLAAVFAGPIAGRFIGKHGGRNVLTVALTLQALMILPLVFLGSNKLALVILVPALFLGFFVHVACIVSYTVIGTSGLPNEEQGLATGLTSMTQQVALTIGAPIMVAIAATQADTLSGTHLALGVNVAVTLVSVALIWFGLRPRDERSASAPETAAAAS
ncbi:MFS transporter [Saccharothrix sp. 6-C]|uniref:MFS transporter n=1 Tax=Saccharothrix sp. 6-C TaxID=2781735 RepID=UPI0019179E1C|nr:MFS transporter [Saccharothrix sp. 6-C]